MRIYLDSSHLIDLLDRNAAGVSPADFKQLLSNGNHKLILSFVTFNEIAAPLWDPKAETSVTKTLTALDEFPVEWIDVTRVPDLEVQQAVNCVRINSRYAPPNPFVANILATIVGAPGIEKLFIKYSLAEIAFDLWIQNI